mgnify:FL=1
MDIFKEGIRRYVMRTVNSHNTKTTKSTTKSSLTKVKKKKKKAPAKRKQCDDDG